MIPQAAIDPATGSEKTVDVGSAVSPFAHLMGCSLDTSGSIVTVAKASATAPTRMQGGLLFDANGSLVVVDSASATAPISKSNGLALDVSGALVVSSGPITSTQGRFGFDATGYLVASGGGSPAAALPFF